MGDSLMSPPLLHQPVFGCTNQFLYLHWVSNQFLGMRELCLQHNLVWNPILFGKTHHGNFTLLVLCICIVFSSVMFIFHKLETFFPVLPREPFTAFTATRTGLQLEAKTDGCVSGTRTSLPSVKLTSLGPPKDTKVLWLSLICAEAYCGSALMTMSPLLGVLSPAHSFANMLH